MKILLAAIKFYHMLAWLGLTFSFFFCVGSEFRFFFISQSSRDVCESWQREKGGNNFQAHFSYLNSHLRITLGGVEEMAHQKKGFISKLNLAYVSNKLRIQGILSPSLSPLSMVQFFTSFIRFFRLLFFFWVSRTFFFCCVGISGERSDTFSFS